ncbi:SGNH/GDSL hydrolase family protein [Patulibacter defluvii]|uniref:SGNH/GDSL hydrolase family protein n=1 Tax=Patulibacter defluvii TaxID=3095358 RepID=UPI002A74C4D0|nr:SGNH/GDSL hydrolase family protein [Patulibacter sp. DM4]
MPAPPDDRTPNPGGRWAGGPRRLIALLAIAVIAVGLVVADLVRRDDQPVRRVAPDAARAVTGEPLEYVALGDSLSRGVQPGDGGPTVTDEGYPRQLAARLRARQRVTLVEAGCGGATTATMIDGGPCGPDAPVPYLNRDRASSQLRWAVRHVRDRADRPTLVTLDIGGNDLQRCVTPDAARLRDCLDRLRPQLERRWRRIARELAAVAGPQTVLAVSTTYDPFVALVRTGTAVRPAVRAMHRTLTRTLNPRMARIFRREGWLVADLARAMAAGDPVRGPSSRPVRAVCDLTWMCARGDVHLNTDGYALAARRFDRATRRSLAALDVR